jgi:small conductance mechanosensitive channel
MALPIPTPDTPREEAAADVATFSKFTDVAGDLAINLTLSILILIATFFVARWASNATEAAIARLHKKHGNSDTTLQQFLSELVRWVVVIIGGVAVLRRLGVETASIIAVLGAASLAIGLALQGALSNVAAGVLLLLIRPYRVGDQLEIAGVVGTVKRLDLFVTELATFDNRKVVIPNSKATGDVVINRTGYPIRRVDLAFDVDYDSDLDHVFRVIQETVEADGRVLADPPVKMFASELKDFSILVTLYAWTKTPDWFQTSYELRKAIKQAFDREGIVIPYPTRVTLQKRIDEQPEPQPLAAE